jgi:hypothetical protein
VLIENVGQLDERQATRNLSAFLWSFPPSLVTHASLPPSPTGALPRLMAVLKDIKARINDVKVGT